MLKSLLASIARKRPAAGSGDFGTAVAHFRAGLAQELGTFDVIIDDGSHLNARQIATFGILWPHLKDGGTYIVENVQTSYWMAFGCGPVGTPGYAQSSMRRFKDFADGVNLPELLEPAPGTLDPGC